MSQSAESDEFDDEAGAAEDAGGGKSRKLLMIVGGAVLLICAGGAGAWFSGALDGLLGGGEVETAEAPAAEAAPPEPVFFSIPELLVTLNTGERRSTYLKLKVSLQIADGADRAGLERLMPRIVDYCQVYLRELRLEDLRGSAGTIRLREELLRRIAAAAAPIRVDDVLFSEMFIQ